MPGAVAMGRLAKKPMSRQPNMELAAVAVTRLLRTVSRHISYP